MSLQIRCKTLLGSSGLDFSIICLKSFIFLSNKEIHLQIFEDGTLTEEHKKHLKTEIPNCSIVDKKDRDQIISAKLNKYPSCLDYRNSTGYAQKLFDIVLYDNQDVFYIDSDILFLQKFSLPNFTDVPVFMSDTFNAYSFQPQEFIKINYPIFPYINSGFFYFPQKLYDLNYLEQLLNDKIVGIGLVKKIPWLEQTLWAFLLAQSKKIYYFEHNQIVMAQQVMKIPVIDNITNKTIAVHLVSSLRGHVFPELKKLTTSNLGNDYQQINLEAVRKHLSKISFAIDRLKKKWRQMRPYKVANYMVNLNR
ncbi:MAG: hypothetical protein EOP43_00220 [Sphingobacteriaceae bacterium]|nr:MAG: hypothetical protein EOP43_00220 [Sphingobacteriaceae bacterium]